MKIFQKMVKSDLDKMPMPKFGFSIRASHRTQTNLHEVSKALRDAKKNRRVITQEDVVELYLRVVHPSGKQPRWVMVKSGGKYSWKFDNDAPIDPEDPRIIRNAKLWLRNALGVAIINGMIQ